MDHSEVKHLPKIDHAPAELDDASRLLLKAAALIEERGLCQTGPFVDDEGRVCVQCALNLAGGYPGMGRVQADVWYTAYRRLWDVVGIDSPAKWIERKDVTQEMCVAKMRAVALGG